MADSDKNILITPNTNQSGFPNIQFVGSSSAPISLNVLDDNSISFSGSEGQLFSIDNNLTSGTIFSVNDVSGIPLIEADADGTVSLAEFGGNVGIGTTSPTAKLEVNGTFIGDVYVSGTVSAPITDTSYTLGSVDRGRTLLFSSSATQAITCSAGFSTGYNCTFVQMGSGQLVLSASSGVSILNRQTHNGSAGLYAAISVVVIDNDTYLLAGDTQ